MRISIGTDSIVFTSTIAGVYSLKISCFLYIIMKASMCSEWDYGAYSGHIMGYFSWCTLHFKLLNHFLGQNSDHAT